MISGMRHQVTKCLLTLCLIFFSTIGEAQFVDSVVGLLMMPSAEMEDSGTVMITNNFLNKAYVENPTHTPSYWGYNTFGYGFDITFLSRIEIAYICTLLNHHWDPYAWRSERESIMFNQDRHFAARIQALKEGEFHCKFIPSLVLGISDPVTGVGGDYTSSNVGSEGNGFFNRAYIVATKHFDTSWGIVGTHVAYQYTVRKFIIPKGPCVGVTWNPVWLNLDNSFLSSFRLIAEYDAKEINAGLTASIWKDHFEFWACLQACQHFNGGARFKFVLSGAH